jgi:hypothetical protein
MLPKAIYEALPAAYIVAGVLSVFLIESPLAFGSGALFGAAGLLAWMQRRH